MVEVVFICDEPDCKRGRTIKVETKADNHEMELFFKKRKASDTIYCPTHALLHPVVEP